MTSHGFNELLLELNNDLSQLLAVPFIQGCGDLNAHPVGVRLRQIAAYQIAAERIRGSGLWALTEASLHNRDLAYLKLSMLRKDLLSIKQHDATMFDALVNTLNGGDTVNYAGTRLEIHIAAYLINEAVSFVKQESPDFVISTSKGRCALECTSVQYMNGKPEGKGTLRKIVKSFNEKASKPYASKDTAILIDQFHKWVAILAVGTS